MSWSISPTPSEPLRLLRALGRKLARLVSCHRSRGDERRLVEQCESFVEGHLAEKLARGGDPVPAWTLTNLLAHASWSELEEELKDARRSRYLAPEWRHARAYLAGQVLAVARECGSLLDLQSAVLVPLEAELAERSRVSTFGPNQWIAGVVRALDEHRRRAIAR